MKTGVFLFPEARDPTKDNQIINETIKEAVTAEQLGADAVFHAEHHFDGNCVYVDPLMFGTALAMRTSRIKIGFAVLQTSLYHPLRLGEQISLLDNLSNGRLIVGLGRGSLVNTHEYEGYQVDPASAQERFEEIEKILLACWAGENVVHAGKYWKFEIPMLRPRPLTKPHPQLLRGVFSEGSLTAQARQGRPVLIGAPSAKAGAQRVALYKSTMREAGFSAAEVDRAISDSWISRLVILAPTDKEALDVGMPYFRQMQSYRATQSVAFESRLAAAASAQQQEPRVLCGSPATLLPEFKALQETGIGGVIVRFRTGPMPTEFSMRAMELFMKEIAPAVREKSEAIPA
jgi:alkanesulfonate monooxygenase SsuD/methylene tetrahydromethanopterin reductase-like flavin-dependent oxidoreductase (luciferase family)